MVLFSTIQTYIQHLNVYDFITRKTYRRNIYVYLKKNNNYTQENIYDNTEIDEWYM